MAEKGPHILITISRQLGAGGSVLGQRLAARLRCVYLDRAILRIAADQIGVKEESLSQRDERLSRFWERAVDALALGPPESVCTTLAVPGDVRDEELFQIESEIIAELARHRSAVVIGRGGFWVLKDQPGVIRLFLHAPAAWRAPQVMQAYGLPSETEALAMIDRMDRQRQRFIRAMTGCVMSDACNYDLSINTQAVGFDAAEQMILRLVEQRQAMLPRNA